MSDPPRCVFRPRYRVPAFTRLSRPGASPQRDGGQAFDGEPGLVAAIFVASSGQASQAGRVLDIGRLIPIVILSKS
jgi:hypothetical protein